MKGKDYLALLLLVACGEIATTGGKHKVYFRRT